MTYVVKMKSVSYINDACNVNPLSISLVDGSRLT